MMHLPDAAIWSRLGAPGLQRLFKMGWQRGALSEKIGEGEISILAICRRRQRGMRKFDLLRPETRAPKSLRAAVLLGLDQRLIALRLCDKWPDGRTPIPRPWGCRYTSAPPLREHIRWKEAFVADAAGDFSRGTF